MNDPLHTPTIADCAIDVESKKNEPASNYATVTGTHLEADLSSVEVTPDQAPLVPKATTTPPPSASIALPPFVPPSTAAEPVPASEVERTFSVHGYRHSAHEGSAITVLAPNDFQISKFYDYRGPNYYLDCQALVFNLYLQRDGLSAAHYLPAISARFPALADASIGRVVTLFAETLIQVLKLDMDLDIHRYNVSRDGDEYVIAVECLDADIAQDAALLVSDWMIALSTNTEFDFETPFKMLEQAFDRTLYGGPTAYSLVEAGLKRGIPLFYFEGERQIQWGYGRKQVRGRSTVLSSDSIKDTEFTTFKDDVKDFLALFGFPTPGGNTCRTEERALVEAQLLGYPVVAKPVAGHKGEGVFTNLRNAEELLHAFRVIQSQLENTDGPQGVIVERFIIGTDHRLITVDGRFTAALERVPAYVDGNGVDSIEQLIALENNKEVRKGHARSPLARIDIDEDLTHFLEGQGLTIDSIPTEGHRIFLRRVANISAGGVSTDVTDRIHPRNAKLTEHIARYFNVTCIGIDVLAEDISKPWDESSFAIIEINAGPGVFMHLFPSIGNPVDVPGKVLEAHFPKGVTSARIPIVAGNQLSQSLCDQLYGRLRELDPKLEYASLTDEGLYLNGEYLHKHAHHDTNVVLALRDPRLDFAVFQHNKDDLLDYGTMHEGADVVILINPHPVEETLRRDLLPGGYLIEVLQRDVVLFQGEKEVGHIQLPEGADWQKLDGAVLALLKPLLPELIGRYH